MRRQSKSALLGVAICLVLGASACLVSGDGSGASYDLWAEQAETQIVFMSRAESPVGELYLLDKSAQIVRLTNNQRHENNPALSPDGRFVAFHAGDEQNPLSLEVYVRNIETGQETQLTSNAVIDGHPDWSPDGSRIVFASFRDAAGNPTGTANVYVVNVDGTGLTQLTDTPWVDNDPEWSPDGTKIVFKSSRQTQDNVRPEIYVMDSDGGNARRLTTTEGWQSDHDPSWSPDSQSIVFSRFEGSRPWTDIANPEVLRMHWQELNVWHVYKVDLDGNLVQLTDGQHADTLPVFSDDGSSVLLLQFDFIIRNDEPIGADHRLVLMAQDGSEQRQLIPDNEHTPTLEYFDW